MTRPGAAMGTIFLFLGACSWAETVPARQPTIQRLLVPQDKLGQLLPKDEITYFRSISEFEELLKHLGEASGAREKSLPTECALEATWDPKTSCLVGTGSWRFAPHQSSIHWGPWNLLVRQIKASGKEMAAGMTRDGELALADLPAGTKSLDIDFALPARRQGEGWVLEPRWPACAVARLRLAVPPGLRVRSTALAERSADGQGPWEIHFGGMSVLSIELVPQVADAEPARTLAWQADHQCLFEESATELHSEIRLEWADRAPDRVTLLLDRRVTPRELRVGVPARWRREDATGDLARWIAELRRPPTGSLRIDLRATLPAALGDDWRLPLFRPENGLPRGETVTFSIPRSLKIESIRGGTYWRTFAGLGTEGRYQLSFRGTGRSPDTVAGTFAAQNVLDWPLLAEQLRSPAGPEQVRVAQRLALAGGQGWGETIGRVARAARPTEADRSQILAALNHALAQADLFPGTTAAAALLSENRRRLGELFPRALSRGDEHEGLPSVRLAPKGIETEIQRQLFLEMRRDAIRLAARFRWRVLEGTLFGPTLRIPPRWVVTEVVGDPAQRLLPHRAEPHEDGGTLLHLPLESPLGSGQTFSATVFAELPAGERPPPREAGEFPFPDIRPQEPTSRAPGTYFLFLDPGLPCVRGGWPPARPGAAEYPWPRRPGELEEYSFAFLSPIAVPPIRLLAEKPRFVAEGLQLVRREGSHWQIDCSLDLDIEQGTVGTLTLAASRELPAKANWRIEGDRPSVPRITLVSGKGPGPCQYKIDLAVPVEKQARLAGSWGVEGASADIPLLELTDTDRYQGRLEVFGTAGERVSVRAKSLAEAPSPLTARPRAEFPVWQSTFGRLADDAALSVDAEKLTVGALPESLGEAVVYCHSIVEPSRVIHDLRIELECRRPGPLELRLPEGATLWDLEWDGDSIPAERDRDRLRPRGSLTMGAHRLLLRYSTHAPHGWFFRRVELLPPLAGWEIVSFRWSMAERDQAMVAIDRRLTESRSLRSLSRPASSSRFVRVGLAEEIPAREALRQAYRGLSEKDRAGAWTTLIRLEQLLPSGWRLLIDRRALASLVTGSDPSPPLSMDGWLRRHGLMAQAGGQTILLSYAAQNPANQGDMAAPEIASWLDPKSGAARVGDDISDRFLPPSELLALRAEVSTDQADPSPLPSGDFRLIELDVTEPNAATPLTIDLVPNRFLEQLGRAAAVALGLAMLVRGRHWSTAQLRRAVLLGLFAVLFAHWFGSIGAYLFVPIAWALTLAPGLVWFYRTRQSVWAPSPHIALTVLLLAVVRPIAAADPLDPAADSFRVLVPYDPADPTKTPGQVAISRSLWERLRASHAGADDAQVRSLSLVGQQREGQIAWQAELDVWRPKATENLLSLPLTGIRVDRVMVNGALASFRPPGKDATFDVAAPAGPSRLQIQFSSPVLGNAPDQEVDIGLPAALRTRVQLDADKGPVHPREDLTSPGLAVSATANHRIEGELGPTRRLRIVWRDSVTKAGSPRFKVATGLLWDVAPEVQDLFAVIRVDPIDGPIERLVFQLDPAWIVRRVDGPVVSKWHIDEGAKRPELLVEFANPVTGPTWLQLQAWIRPVGENSAKLMVPVARGAESASAIAGLRLPVGWETPPPSGNEGLPVEAFLSQWRRFEQPNIERVVLARSWSSGSGEWDISFHKADEGIAVQSQLQLTPHPIGRFCEVTGSIRIRANVGSLSLVRCQLPRGVSIQQLTAPGLWDWFVEGNALTLLAERPVTGDWEIQPRGQLGPMGQKGFPVAGWGWSDARSTESLWNLAVPSGWNARVTGRKGVAVIESPGAPPAIHANATPHSFQLELEPATSRLRARGTTIARVQGEQMEFFGRLELASGADSLPLRIEVIASAVRPIQFRSEELRLAATKTRASRQVYTFDRVPSATSPVILEWELRLPIPERGSAEVPRLMIPQAGNYEQWIALATPAALSVERSRGVQETDVDGAALQWPAEAPLPAVGNRFHGWRAEQDAWELVVRATPRAADIASYLTRQAMAEIYVAADGVIWGANRWEILDQRAAEVVVRVPPDTTVNDVLLDGRSLLPLEEDTSKIRVALPRKGGWQNLVLYWKRPAGNEAKEWLPGLEGADAGSTLLRVRLPANDRLSSNGAIIDKPRWLLRRVEWAIDHVADALALWEARPGPAREEAAVIALARARLLLLQTDGAIRAAKVPSAAIQARQSALRARLGELVSRHHAESVLGRAEDRWVDIEEFALSRSRAAARRVEYLDGDAMALASIRIEKGADDAPRPIAAERYVTALAIALAGLVIALPATWPWVTLYWSAGVLPFGLAFVQWGPSPWLGMFLILWAISGAAWNVRRWFSELPDWST